MGIFAFIIFGLIAGAIAQLLMPGSDPGGSGFKGIAITVGIHSGNDQGIGCTLRSAIIIGICIHRLRQAIIIRISKTVNFPIIVGICTTDFY